MIAEKLRKKLQGEVLDDTLSLGMYATDASIYQIMPKVIVFPRSEEDVKKAVTIASQEQVTILPRGAGTSLAGQTVGASMILDFSRHMNQVLEINAEEKWVRVQPGIARDDLNALLEQHGLHFAPDPATSSRANVGGMVGNNSSGTKSILYGKTVDHLLEARVLLADGTTLELSKKTTEQYQSIAIGHSREAEIYRGVQKIINSNREEIEERYPKVMRRVGGYNLDEFIDKEDWNLSKLICGSEGTLGIILDLKLNLEPLPRCKCVCVVHYAELLEAIAAVETMLQFRPSAVEILDHVVVGLSRENLTTKRHSHFIEGDPAAILIVEFYGDTQEDVMKRAESMIEDQKAQGFGYAFPLYPEGSDYDDVWVIRKKGLGLMLGLKEKKKPLAFIEDAGIPSEHLPAYIDEVLQVCKKHGANAAMYAHASVGVIHVRPILDLREAEDIERLKLIAEDTFELVKKYGGSWSGEHGDGLVRSAFNQRFFGEKVYQAFVNIKQLFDPQSLMNPGKIVEAQSIEENLRYGTAYRDQPVKTEFKYQDEGSFEESVHMCTGVGECRKMLGGTMCPSFKATRDEEHSTRGRANALRLAMSGQVPGQGISSERLHQVMDLCLSCKACKSECPSNVDMAKMKSDVSQKYYDAHGVTFRDRLIRDSSQFAAKMAGWKSGVVNLLQRSSVFKRVLSSVAGIHPHRTLPEYTSQPFHRWFAKRKTAETKDQKVVLFADTYLNYHQPALGKAATSLLESLGYAVQLGNVGCCQRPRISHGFLRDARAAGTKTALGLKPWLDQGYTVVVCEPSCASALNDDLPDLIDDPELADQLRHGVVLIDEFVAGKLATGNVNLKCENGAVAVHGHCHQKALYGTNSLKKIYKHVPGLEVLEIPSGCCGMAGSFGYEKEHYSISKKIGEDILFPAVEKLSSTHAIVANGFSCRHQIEHFTGVKAKHWVETISVKK